MSFHYVFETAMGFCGIAWSERGIRRFALPMSAPASVEERMTRSLQGSIACEPQGTVAEAVEATRCYFAGERIEFSSFPLDLEDVDAFRHAIYGAARRLVYGQTTTYGRLAADAGFPQSARETGVALGRNPVPLIIPCHRILAAGGKLGGFSAPGGTTTKQRMLALEKAQPPNSGPMQPSFAF